MVVADVHAFLYLRDVVIGCTRKHLEPPQKQTFEEPLSDGQQSERGQRRQKHMRRKLCMRNGVLL